MFLGEYENKAEEWISLMHVKPFIDREMQRFSEKA